MDFWVILYSLICVVVGGGAVSFLYKRNQSIAAMITLVLLLLVFILYGLRWFPGGNLNGSKPKGGSWPPIVNMCPDFMASWKDPRDGNKIYCYDAANLYNLKTTTVTDFSISKEVNNVPGQAVILLQNPLGTSPATKNPLKETLKKTPAIMTANTATSAIRWEGVWDGRLVTADRVPSI
jgi:hypothetical protein